MHKVLIAGSTGFLGQALTKKLSEDNDLSLKTINRQSGDYLFSDLESIDEDFDLIFVLFAQLPDKTKSLEEYMDVNYELTKKLLSKFPASRFLFSSSISVYENSQKKPSKEEDLSADISDYAISKLEAESLFENKDAIILRLSSLYGPGMREKTFLPIVVNSALNNGEIKLIGDQTRKQNYSFVDDVVDDLIKAGFSKETGIFNAVNEKSYSNKELADYVLELVPGTKLVEVEDSTENYSYEISTENWHNCFKTKSKISLKDGLKRYIENK